MNEVIIPDGTKVPVFDVHIDTRPTTYRVAATLPSQAARALMQHCGQVGNEYLIKVVDHRGYIYAYTATVTPNIKLEEI